MLVADRRDNSLLGRWWWTIDRPTFLAFAALMIVGLFLVFSGSPAVAARLELDSLYFVRRQIMFIGMALLVILGVSLIPVRRIFHLAGAVLGISALLMVAVLFVGDEAKGASRWISMSGISIQPSEFMKPAFCVVAAWLFSEPYRRPEFRGRLWAGGLYVVLLLLLLAQPDLGMAITLTILWAGEFFLSGLAAYWVVGLGGAGMLLLLLGYVFFPHVTKRIDSFLDPSASGNYQVKKSLEAFREGGFFGAGAGEGVVKKHLPDSHTDFIFAVAGEEFGAIACLGIIGVILFIILRSAARVWGEKDLSVTLAVAGLLILFGVQSMINIGVALNLLPTKGMTLPLISYGGSSTLAYAFAAGMLLALTRKRYGKS